MTDTINNLLKALAEALMPHIAAKSGPMEITPEMRDEIETMIELRIESEVQMALERYPMERAMEDILAGATFNVDVSL